MLRRMMGTGLLLLLLTGLVPARAQDRELVLLGQVIAATPELTLFAQAIDHYGLNEILNNQDLYYTVFALDDATFLQLLKDLGGYTSLDAIDKDKDVTLLGYVLRYHIIAGFNTGEALQALDNQFDEPVKISGGLPGTVITLQDGLLNGEVKIKTQDILSDNGMIHIVDKALIPEADTFGDALKRMDAHNTLIEGSAKNATIAQQLRQADNFSLITKALEMTGILDELDTKGPYTVFVMTDDAFNKALNNAGITFEDFTQDKGRLTRTLVYHIVPGTGSSALIKAMDGVLIGTMLPGTFVAFSVERNLLMVNATRILTPDILASNGIIHVIDGVLLPPALD